MSKVVIKSYYIIKIKNHQGKGDSYLAGNIEKDGILLTRDKSKATRFEYFGLKGMEKSLEMAMKYISELKEKGIKEGITIVGGDIMGDISDIEDIEIIANMKFWNNIINDDLVNGMIEMSKDEDGEPTENYVYIYKFLNHAKRLRFGDIMNVVANWNRLDDVVKTKLAVGYAGNYNASRFMLLMDYLSSNVLNNAENFKNLIGG